MSKLLTVSQWLTVNSLLITYHGLVLLILLCDDGRFLVTRERVRNQIGYLVLNLVELLLGGLLELLDGFGARLFDLLRQPVLSLDVEAADEIGRAHVRTPVTLI